MRAPYIRTIGIVGAIALIGLWVASWYAAPNYHKGLFIEQGRIGWRYVKYVTPYDPDRPRSPGVFTVHSASLRLGVLGMTLAIAVAAYEFVWRLWSNKRGVCSACGYSLRGLTEPRCPECGRSFSTVRSEA
ncbi:MAG: hypothetical protein KDA32_08445 [Phycisphaerales bacterium]|nr:hypothetical protein [Phycisphaerales bacterium]